MNFCKTAIVMGKRGVGEGEGGGWRVSFLLVMLYGSDAHQHQHADEEKPERGVCLRQSEILHEPSIMSTPLGIFLGEFARHNVEKRV